MNNTENKIKEQRKNLAHSIRELASLSNVLERDIVAYESNKKIATLKTLKKIANATGTEVSDWVDEVYFDKSNYIKKVYDEVSEEISEKDTNELALCFYTSMFRADNTMDTLYNALIEMKEIEKNRDGEIIFSEFSKKILISISSLKLKKVFKACGRSEDGGTSTRDVTVKKNNSGFDINKTFNDLPQELRVVFKNTDIIEVIIQSLINIGDIDISGCRSEKANILLTTIISNKVESLITKK